MMPDDPNVPAGVDAAARALVEVLRAEVEKRPALGNVARILARALPTTADQIKDVLDNPGAALLGAVSHHTRAAREELDDSDQAIARGLVKAFGRGFTRAAAKPTARRR